MRRWHAAVCILPLVWMSCGTGTRARPETLRLGSQVLETTLPIEVALQNRFFQANGLDVSVTEYDTGLAALNATISGLEDVAVGVSDYVFTTKVLAGEKLKAIACIDKNDFVHLIARKDRGIRTVRDLEWKKVGVLPGTAQEFYLNRFLGIHGVDSDKVPVVNPGTLPDGVGLVAGGGVDALVTVDPYLSSARGALGGNAIVWPAQGSQPVFLLLVCRSEWIPGHEDAVVKLLGALRQSEEYILWHPSEAKKVAQTRMEFSADQVEALWQRNEYSLSLDMGLVAAMEDEARWLIGNGMAKASMVPDFVDSLYIAGMRKAAPEGLSVIH